MQYKQVHEIAIKKLKQLEPSCTRVNIAGSIAREKEFPKDIEICCTPHLVNNIDLFGAVLGDKKRMADFVRTVKSFGNIVSGDIEKGRYIKIDLHEGIRLDLFIPQENDYFRQYSIRVGSSEYSHKVLATAWRKLGWVGTPDGLRRIDECYSKEVSGKKHWICNSIQPILPPVWESEYDFFKFLNLEWVEPHKRYV